MLHEMSIPKYEKNTVALHNVSVLGDGLHDFLFHDFR